MSDYDPMRRDPKRPAVDEAGHPVRSGMNWNWVIGGIAAIVVLIVALSFVGREDQTADTGPRPTTTGQSVPTQAEPAAPSATRPTIPANPAPAAAPPAPAPAEPASPAPANPN
jgi:hypothetical protein